MHVALLRNRIVHGSEHTVGVVNVRKHRDTLTAVEATLRGRNRWRKGHGLLALRVRIGFRVDATDRLLLLPMPFDT